MSLRSSHTHWLVAQAIAQPKTSQRVCLRIPEKKFSKMLHPRFCGILKTEDNKFKMTETE